MKSKESKLTEYQVANISFFKNYKQYESFYTDKSKDKWKAVNDFYKWQLLRRNEEYNKFYEITSVEEKKYQNSETKKQWNFEPLINPDQVYPPKKLTFSFSPLFMPLHAYSFEDLRNLKKDFIKMINSRIIQSSVEEPLGHKNDKRFLLIAIDLDQQIEDIYLGQLETYLRRSRSEYLKSGYAKKMKRTRRKKSVIDLEKSIYIFDYNAKNGSLTGIEKEYRKKYGIDESIDLSAIIDRLNTITENIENSRYLNFDFKLFVDSTT